MSAFDALLQDLEGRSCPVSGIYVGAFQTAVTARSTGLASTYRGVHSCHDEAHGGVRRAGQLLEQDAPETARLALSAETVEASIGLATINAMLTPAESDLHALGAFELLAQRGRGKDVAVVGHFPFAARLKETARNLWIIERNPQPGDLAETEAQRVLPDCDVVCLTGTTLCNHTFDDLVALCSRAYVALVGPTAPLSPVLFDFGVDAVCGARVTNPDAVIRHVVQSATFHQLRRAGVRLATLVKP
jgi:uncharacterized protein (DUF4213/DUF364 family)